MKKKSNLIERLIAKERTRWRIRDGSVLERARHYAKNMPDKELFDIFYKMRERNSAEVTRIEQYLKERQEWSVVDAARDGYWGHVKLYINRGGTLTEELQDFLGKVLDGEKRLPNRPPSFDIFIRHGKIANFVVKKVLDGQIQDAAYEEAANEFGMSKRHVERICTSRAPAAVEMAFIEKYISAEFEEARGEMDIVGDELKRRAARSGLDLDGFERRVRYSVCPTALSPHFVS
jgi:hypothetical protein